MSKHIYLFDTANEADGASFASRRAASEFIDWSNEYFPRHDPALYQPNKTPTYIGYTGISTLDEVIPKIQSIEAPLVLEVLPLNSLLSRGDIYRHHGIQTLMERLTELLENSECPYVIVLGLEAWRVTEHVHSVYRVIEAPESRKLAYDFTCIHRKA